MISPTITDDLPIDLVRDSEAERHSVVQPTADDDKLALEPGAVQPTPSPRSQSTELVQQPWSDEASSQWRRAPK